MKPSEGHTMKLENGGTRTLTPQEKEFVDRTFPDWQLYQNRVNPDNLQPLIVVKPSSAEERRLAMELKPNGIRMKLEKVFSKENAEEGQDIFQEIFGTGDVREALTQLIENPDAWLDAPMDFTGGRTPRELLGTADERIIKEQLLRAALGILT